MELKKVTLNAIHETELKAKMVGFAGFYMPVRYSSDKEEHFAVRNAVGVFDVSHMGEFFLKGKNALTLIQKVTSNDASKLQDGKAQYSCLPNDKGGIVDDLLVYRINEEEYMLVVNAANIQKDWQWIQQQNTEGVAMENRSDDYSLFAVQGPKATEVLQTLTNISLADIPYYSFTIGEIAQIPEVIISATGYTGAGGFELYVSNERAIELWRAIFEAGKPYNIQPVGLGARDTLRLEKGYCLYGNDIDDSTSPLEAGLGWITKFDKNIPFINQENLFAQKQTGVTRKLVAFKMKDKGIPRGHYLLFNKAGEQTGVITSGTISPVLNIGIGLGYVKTTDAVVGSTIFVEIRNKQFEAEIVKLPFV